MPAGADDAGVAPCAEQEPNRLRQDRLAGARLACDRSQAGARRELALADEHEVLDPEATKQGPAVAAEERHFGERREQGALLADARDRARPRPSSPTL